MPGGCTPMNSKSLVATLAITVSVLGSLPAVAQQTLTGEAAFTDYSKEHPGVKRKITVADLPAPYSTPSANNGAAIAPRPDGVWPQTLPGFKVEQFATDLEEPRLIRLSRHRPRRQGRQDGGLRQRPEGTLRDQLLPQRAESAVGVRGEHCVGGPVSLPKRRPEGAWPGADPDVVARGRWPHHPRHCLYPG